MTFLDIYILDIDYLVFHLRCGVPWWNQGSIYTTTYPGRSLHIETVSCNQNGKTYQESLGSIDSPNSCNISSCSSSGRLLLAKDILGLSHQDAGSSGQTISSLTNLQSVVWNNRSSMGMATRIHLWIDISQKYRGKIGSVSIIRSGMSVAIPNHECWIILSDRSGSLLLGIR